MGQPIQGSDAEDGEGAEDRETETPRAKSRRTVSCGILANGVTRLWPPSVAGPTTNVIRASSDWLIGTTPAPSLASGP